VFCRKLFVKGGRSKEKVQRSSSTVVEFEDGEVYDSNAVKAAGPRKPGTGKFYLHVSINR
jgi:hypothetical protein